LLRSGLVAGAGIFAAKTLRAEGLATKAGNGVLLPDRVTEIVDGTTVIDMLGLLTLDWPRLFAWQRDPTGFLEADFQRLVASGITIFHPAVETNAADPYRGARRWLANWNTLVQGRPRFFLPVLAVDDLDRARREQRIGILLGFQNSDHFRTVADVELFHGLGQRVSQLTYNTRTRLGSGCRDPQDIGLTDFGREVVAAMNRVGMAIDLSHCSERTTLETIERSMQPVLITHANSKALSPHPRNKSDQTIRALARRGGVIGITAVKAFIKPTATLDDLLDHFVHVANLVGVDHVGLGSDCDPDPRDPATGRVRAAYDIRGLRHQRRAYDLAAGLFRRGFREPDVAKILGGNFQRALGQIWPAPPPPPPQPLLVATPEPVPVTIDVVGVGDFVGV
jgi:membrane dipeptidase